ncbi:MAG: amidohydrolase [Planctomycetota bacterium]|nr:amidohydrolase [Planctomycetota bacterium]
MNAHEIIKQSIARISAELRDLALRIHRHPEVGLAEVKACAWQIEILQRLGFTLETNYAGLATAYRAQKGKGRPAVAFLAEYDALPGIGHGCGHNLICSAAIAAGQGLAEALAASGREGTSVILGTPAEEGKGGKVQIIARGGLNGIDAALMAHPYTITTADAGCLAVKRYDVIFHGQSAHASVAPEEGRNALDAVMLLFHGINAWRQHLPAGTRIHGIVTEGGHAPNIVPERAAASFYLRAADDRVLAAMIERFQRIAEGAALMTATRAEVRVGEVGYRAGRPNPIFNAEYLRQAEDLGLEPQAGAKQGLGSTDFGDVSQIVPAAHLYFGIVSGVPLHSPEFAAAAATEEALRRMLLAGEALARIAYRFCVDATFQQEALAAFQRA